MSLGTPVTGGIRGPGNPKKPEADEVGEVTGLTSYQFDAMCVGAVYYGVAMALWHFKHIRYLSLGCNAVSLSGWLLPQVGPRFVNTLNTFTLAGMSFVLYQHFLSLNRNPALFAKFGTRTHFSILLTGGMLVDQAWSASGAWYEAANRK